MLYSGYSLAIYFIDGSIYTSILLSIHPTLSFPCFHVHRSVLYICVSIPALQIGYQYHFSRFCALNISNAYSKPGWPLIMRLFRAPTPHSVKNPMHNLTSAQIPAVQSVTQSCPPLWPHGLQHAKLHCPSPTPGAYSNSCPLSRWCHPTISSSVVPFSSHLQSFPAFKQLGIVHYCRMHLLKKISEYKWTWVVQTHVVQR